MGTSRDQAAQAARTALGNIVRYQTGSLDPSTSNPFLAPSYVGGRADTIPADGGFATYAPGPQVGSGVWVPSVTGIGVQSSDATGGSAGGARMTMPLLIVGAILVGWYLYRGGLR